jgi:peptide/nickel transport system substrate-binding protein
MRARPPAFPLAILLAGAAGSIAAATVSGASGRPIKNGGIYRVSTPNIAAIDPAIDYGTAGAYLDATCAKLYRLADKPRRAGFGIVPEVAAGPPKVSRDRRTYTFRLRKTFRFDTGAPLTAAAFAREINRVLNPALQSPAQSLFSDIVGAQDVLSGRATTAHGVQAHGYTLTIQLTQPVPDLVARLTDQAACSVLPDLPADPEGVGAPLAAAGPYYIAEYVQGQKLVVRRNRFYRGSRPHHVDGFAVTIGGDPLAQVLAGNADLADTDASSLAAADRARGQFFSRPGGGDFYLVMNTARPLFRGNVSLRRAVNFVIEREALRAVYGGPAAGTLTDHYLGSGTPGFRPAHIYPLSRPDLRRARSLAQGHTRGGKAVLYTHDSGRTVPAGKIVQRDLARIGISVTIKQFPGEQYFTRIFNLQEPFDLALVGWTPDYPDPYDVLNQLFSGASLKQAQSPNLARFDSPLYNRLLQRAALLSGTSRYRDYGKLDIRLARDAAPAAAFLNETVSTFVSSRTGCVVVHPYIDLAAVCLK